MQGQKNENLKSKKKKEHKKWCFLLLTVAIGIALMALFIFVLNWILTKKPFESLVSKEVWFSTLCSAVPSTVIASITIYITLAIQKQEKKRRKQWQRPSFVGEYFCLKIVDLNKEALLKNKLREKLVEMRRVERMEDFDTSLSLDIRVKDRNEGDGFTITDITINGFDIIIRTDKGKITVSFSTPVILDEEIYPSTGEDIHLLMMDYVDEEKYRVLTKFFGPVAKRRPGPEAEIKMYLTFTGRTYKGKDRPFKVEYSSMLKRTTDLETFGATHQIYQIQSEKQ